MLPDIFYPVKVCELKASHRRKVFRFKMHINGVLKLFSRATDDRSDQKAS